MLTGMAIRDWPIDERPREKLLEKGPAALSDAELLAILLRTGTPGHSALDLARALLQSFQTLRAGPSLASPRATRDFLSSQLRDLEHEVFCCLYLDKRHRLIQYQELFRGTIDGASVHPREIVKLALQRNSAAVIIAHNHPSGVAEPSQADEFITQRVKEALTPFRQRHARTVAHDDVIEQAERGLV